MRVWRNTMMLIGVVLVIVAGPVQAQDGPAPYMYYYSETLNAFVIERADGTDSRMLGQGLGLSSPTAGPGWSPSGEWLAWTHSSIDGYGVVYSSAGYILRADGSALVTFPAEPVEMKPGRGAKVLLGWSPVEDKLWVIEDYRSGGWEGSMTVVLSLLDMTTGDTLAAFEREVPPEQWLGPLGWTPDGAWAGFYTDRVDRENRQVEGVFLLLSAAGELVEQRIDLGTADHMSVLGWSPDRRAVAFSYGQYNLDRKAPDLFLVLWRRDSAEMIERPDLMSLSSWSPEGWLAYHPLDRAVLVFEHAASGEQFEVALPGETAEVADVVWNPAGTTALVAVEQGETVGLWMVSLAEQTAVFIDDSIFSVEYNSPFEINYPLFDNPAPTALWTLDGRQALFRSAPDAFSVLDPQTGAVQVVQVDVSAAGENLARLQARWSPDGETFFFRRIRAFYDPPTMTVDLKTGEVRQDDMMQALMSVFNPDGKRLIVWPFNYGDMPEGYPRSLVDLQSGEKQPLPAHSQATMGMENFIWHPSEEWVITGSSQFVAGGGYPYLLMGVMTTDGGAWRELGTCIFTDACPGWLPERVDVASLPPGAPESVLLAPVEIDYDVPPVIVSGSLPEESILTLTCDATLPEGQRRVLGEQPGDVVAVLDYGQSCPSEEWSGEEIGAVSPDGRLVALGGIYGDSVTVWDAVSGARLMALNTLGYDISFSADGALLYTRGRTARLTWDVAEILDAGE